MYTKNWTIYNNIDFSSTYLIELFIQSVYLFYLWSTRHLRSKWNKLTNYNWLLTTYIVSLIPLIFAKECQLPSISPFYLQNNFLQNWRYWTYSSKWHSQDYWQKEGSCQVTRWRVCQSGQGNLEKEKLLYNCWVIIKNNVNNNIFHFS